MTEILTRFSGASLEDEEKETLLRMIAEIMTYTDGYEEGVYKKAIAFFEKNCDDGSITSQQ